MLTVLFAHTVSIVFFPTAQVDKPFQQGTIAGF